MASSWRAFIQPRKNIWDEIIAAALWEQSNMGGGREGNIKLHEHAKTGIDQSSSWVVACVYAFFGTYKGSSFIVHFVYETALALSSLFVCACLQKAKCTSPWTDQPLGWLLTFYISLCRWVADTGTEIKNNPRKTWWIAHLHPSLHACHVVTHPNRCTVHGVTPKQRKLGVVALYFVKIQATRKIWQIAQTVQVRQLCTMARIFQRTTENAPVCQWHRGGEIRRQTRTSVTVKGLKRSNTANLISGFMLTSNEESYRSNLSWLLCNVHSNAKNTQAFLHMFAHRAFILFGNNAGFSYYKHHNIAPNHAIWFVYKIFCYKHLATPCNLILF